MTENGPRPKPIEYAPRQRELRSWQKLVIEFMAYLCAAFLHYILLALLLVVLLCWRWFRSL